MRRLVLLVLRLCVGNLNNSVANCGVSCSNCNNSLGNTNWNIGGRDSVTKCFIQRIAFRAAAKIQQHHWAGRRTNVQSLQKGL